MPADVAVAAGAAGGAGSGVATGNAGADTQTEEEILGLSAEDAGSVSSETEVVDAAAQTAAATQTDEERDAAAAAAAADQLNPDEVPSVIPPELKHLMADAKVAPHLQRVFDQVKAYSALGTVRDARTFAEEFPGGVKEAVEAKNRSLDVADWDAQYESGDPRAQEDLAQSWFEHAQAAGRPEVFRGQVAASLGVLKKNDPQGYKQLTGGSVGETFNGELIASDGRPWNLAAQMDAISSAIKAKDGEALEGLSYFLIRELSQMGLGKKEAGGRVPKEIESVKAREEQAGERERQADQRDHDFVMGSIKSEVMASFNRSLAQTLTAALKGTAFNEKGRASITKAVVDGILVKLNADRSFMGRMRQFESYGKSQRWNQQKIAEQRADLVKFTINRAVALRAGVLKAVLEEETGKFVTASRDANTRRAGAGARVDITGGQSGRTSRPKLTQRQAQEMPDSEKDALLDAAFGAAR